MFQMFPIYPMIPMDYNIPPTLYSIMDSMVNYDTENKTKIKDLASATHSKIFDFNYPLSINIKKDEFECLILNHFIMRRIGYETMTAFKIALQVKLNEVMPIYNKMFDMLEGWNLFTDGEQVIREEKIIGETKTESNSKNITDNRYADTPQGQIQFVQNGSYLSDYTYNTNNGEINSSGDDKRNTEEIIKRTPADKIKIYKGFIQNKESIYTMLFKDLDSLFYGLG